MSGNHSGQVGRSSGAGNQNFGEKGQQQQDFAEDGQGATGEGESKR